MGIILGNAPAGTDESTPMQTARCLKAFGGHLEAGTSVFTFAIVTIGVLPDGLDLSRLDDKTYQ